MHDSFHKSRRFYYQHTIEQSKRHFHFSAGRYSRFYSQLILCAETNFCSLHTSGLYNSYLIIVCSLYLLQLLRHSPFIPEVISQHTLLYPHRGFVPGMEGDSPAKLHHFQTHVLWLKFSPPGLYFQQIMQNHTSHHIHITTIGSCCIMDSNI